MTNDDTRSGLTIPLQITLSEIKLSAFIILVFSRQKGLTLVFRNDPLESLKVSSTFDSIPFVRDYLQKEIEGQLRVLLMEDVPAIIHRLSLRLWVPEYRTADDGAAESAAKDIQSEKVVDPLASPPQNPIDSVGNLVDASDLSSLSLDSNGSEHHSLFSQKNLLRLAALTDSHRTLSLFTPTIRDAVFRAWAGASERGEGPGTNTPNTATTGTFSNDGSIIDSMSDMTGASSLPSRPSLTSFGSAASGLSYGFPRHGKMHAGRKKKHRVINLRRTKSYDSRNAMSEDSRPTTPQTATSAEAALPLGPVEEKVNDPVTPPRTPNATVRFSHSPGSIDLGNTPQKRRPITPPSSAHEATDRLVHHGTQTSPESHHGSASSGPSRPVVHKSRPSFNFAHMQSSQPEKGRNVPSTALPLGPCSAAQSLAGLDNPPSGILEQAWMMKIAGEIVRRAQEEKAAGDGVWRRSESDDLPPPAYRL